MKIVPLCVALAFASPAAAAIRRGERRVEEDFSTAAPTEEEVTNEDAFLFTSTSSGSLSIGQDAPLLAVQPTPAPTFSASYIASMEEAGLWEDPALSGSGGGDAERHKNSKKDDDKSGKYTGSGTGTAPGACSSFCETYLDTCEGANQFNDFDSPRGAPARRRLIQGDEPEITRLGESTFGSIDECITACAGYPRPFNPNQFDSITGQTGTNFLDSNSVGDTFYCRQTHLNIAATSGDFNTIQVHCPAASPSGGGICINAEIGIPLFDADDGDESPLNEINATVWELLRTGSDTGRHLGYCQLYYHDLIADCTKAGLDDVTLPVALTMLPGTIEVLILSNNVRGTTGTGINTIVDGTFSHLICPSCIRALILDEGNVASLTSGAFSPLINLEMLSLNFQPSLTSLPSGLLDPLPLLREFTMAHSAHKPGGLTAATLPQNLLFRNPLMRRFVLTGHKSLDALSIGFFKNNNGDLSVMEIIDLSNNLLTNNGNAPTNLPAGMFNNMGNLEYLDLSNNRLTKGDAGWFSAGWGFNLRILKLHGNRITSFDTGIFDTLEKLEVVLAHDNDGIIASGIGAFENNPLLISYTVGKN